MKTAKRTACVHTKLQAGKVYLSPMIDGFAGMVVTWTIGTSADVELVNTLLDVAVAGLMDIENGPS